jgi:Mce-associated membrane protein
MTTKSDAAVDKTPDADLEPADAETDAAEVTTESADAESDAVEAQPVETDAADTDRRSRLGAARLPLVPVLLAVALVASAALAGWLYFSQYKPDQETGPAAANAAIEAAKSGTIAVLTYKPDSLDSDIAKATSQLTGDFLNEYKAYAESFVIPAVRQKEVNGSATVTRAAVSSLTPDTATVLVFANTTSTSKERPTPAVVVSSIKVSLNKVDGSWLISKFEPV